MVTAALLLITPGETTSTLSRDSTLAILVLARLYIGTQSELRCQPTARLYIGTQSELRCQPTAKRLNTTGCALLVTAKLEVKVRAHTFAVWDAGFAFPMMARACNTPWRCVQPPAPPQLVARLCRAHLRPSQAPICSAAAALVVLTF